MKRIKQGLPPFDSLDPNQKKTALEKQRAELIQSTQTALKSEAWSLGRYPLSAYPAPRSGNLELPRQLYATFGCDRVSRPFISLSGCLTNLSQVKFKMGDNLNLLTC
ncbi:hypothetical protein BDN70DRAFT_877283 [Pholiota conissans]|uniref:Uncharacterized protein n=1 Tax=Pholiota conissans TaxID=109636 RepID=A0A9P6CVG4_9AGAR|nr:hypothetical protein BDN70DRAFT_877283 [Pholiota conissans]